MIAPCESIAPLLSVRSWQPADNAAVADLFWRGRLGGQSHDRTLPADLCEIAAHYFDRPQDHFWVAVADDRVVGCLAVVGGAPHVASLRRLRVDPAWQQQPVVERLLQAAVEHCRAHCILKVLLQTPIDSQQAIALLEGLGLQASRRHSHNDEPVEFYLNLYVKPRTDSFYALAMPLRRPPAARQCLVDKLARALHARCDAWAFASLSALLPRLLASLEQAMRRPEAEREDFVRNLVLQNAATALQSDGTSHLDALCAIVNKKVTQLQRILQHPAVCAAPSTWFG